MTGLHKRVTGSLTSMLPRTPRRDRVSSEPRAHTTRILWIDAARAFAVLAVLLLHYDAYVIQVENPNPQGIAVIWTWITTQLQPVRMPLLLFMSGMLASRKLLSREHAPAAARGISSFYLNAVWTTVYFLISFLLVQESPGEIHSIGEWALHIVSPGTNLWFIWALGFWAFAFILLKRLPPPLVLALFFFTGMLADLTRADLPSRVVPVLIYGIYFALGVYGRRYAMTMLQSDVLIKAAALIVLYMTMNRLTEVEDVDRIVASTLITVRSVVAIALFVSLFVIICWWKPLGRALAFVGRRTLSLFVCHLPLLWLVLNVPAVEAVLTPLGFEALWPVFGVIFLAGGSLAFELLARKVGAGFLFDPPQFLLPKQESRNHDSQARSQST